MPKVDGEMVDNDDVDPMDTWREMEKLYAVGKVGPLCVCPEFFDKFTK